MIGMGLVAGLWVDGDNVAAAARRAGCVVHYEMLRKHFVRCAGVDSGNLAVAEIVLHAHHEGVSALRQRRFIEMARQAGFRILSVDGYADWVDRFLEIEVMEYVCRFGEELVVGIVTGDGGYVPLVRYLTACRGNRVIVYGFAGDTSRELRDAASEFVDLEKAGLVVRRPGERDGLG